MAISKIILNGVTQMDLTQDTVAANNLISPNTAHGADGEAIVGSASQGITPTGTKTISITENGTTTEDVTNYANAQITVNVPSSGSSKNVQIAQSTSRASSSTYTSLVSLTCSKTGKYDIYWDCFRSSTGGTSGSQLYIGGSEYGTANTAFTNHIQTNHLTNVSLTANQTVAVYARSRGSNYYAYVGQLTIIEA